MKKIKVLLFMIFLSTSFLLLVPSGKAQASSADILKKWTRINAYECIVDYGLLLSPVSQKYDNGTVKTSAVLDTILRFSTQEILTPSYGFGGTTSGSNVVCHYVIDSKSKQYNGMTNLLTYGGKANLSGIKWNDSSPSNVEQLLTALDYVGEETPGGGGRFSIKAHRSTETCVTSFSTHCSTSEVETSTVGITVTRNENGTLHYQRDSGNFWNDLQVSFNNGDLVLSVATGLCTGGGELAEPLQGDLNVMYSNLEHSLTNTTWSVYCTTTSVSGIIATTTSSTTKYTFGVSDKVIDSSEISQYVINDQPAAVANKVNRNLTGSSYRAFTSTEQYELYDFYLDKAIVAGGAAANLKTCNPTKTDNLQPVKLLDTSDNTFKTCYINLGSLDANNTKVNAPNADFTKIIEITLAEVINRLDNLDTSSIDIAAITGVEPSTDPYAPLPGSNNNNSSTGGDPDPCGDGVGSLGWILCPVVNLLSNTVQDFYNNYLQQNFLEVNSSWLGSSTDLYVNGWSQFRNYANIVLTIILIIVVLSQITGFGITNYGIKKMLPRIVMMAVLINISFFICQLAVDISNILGYSISKLFVNLSVDFGGSSAAAGGGVGWLNTLSIAGLGLTALTIGQWIVPLLFALLTSIISVAFAGIILGIRQAGILILIVIAPLAFACYAFDGTKSWFDKWRKLFINLLIVFPICGLLMGGGVYASNLLASAPSAGIFIKLIAVMLKVVPFFFIPTMVKGALAAIGNIGAKVGTFGRGLRGSATKMGRASDLYQRFDAGAGVLQGKGMRGIKSLIGKGVRKIPGGEKFAEGKVGRFMGRFGNRRIARYAQKEYNIAASDATADAIAEGGFLNTERREGMKAAAKEKAEAQGTEEQQALYRTKLGEAGVASDTTLKKAIEEIQDEFDKKPQDVTLRRKLKALTKFLLDFDDGRGELARQYHNLISSRPNSASAQAMDAFLNRGENMATIKQSGQRGLQAMVQDRAQGKTIGSLAHYAATKAEKPDMNAVGRIDTSFLKAQLAAMQDNATFATLTDTDKTDMGDWLQLYQDALNNPHTKGSINLESKDLIKQITSAAAARGITPILRP